MKELVFKKGGRPFYNDDLETLQTDVYEALTGVLKGLGKAVIVSGCEVIDEDPASGAAYLNDGLVFIDGQILRFDKTRFERAGTKFITRNKSGVPPIDSRTYNNGSEEPAIVEEKAVLVRNEPSDDFERISITGLDSRNYHEEERDQLSSFIKANIGGADRCILNGLEGFKETIRGATSTNATLRFVSFSDGATIFFNNRVYSVVNRSLRVNSLSKLKFVYFAEDRRFLELVDEGDPRTIVVAFDDLEYYNDLRKNQLFPTGTVLHIRLSQDDFEDYFPPSLNGKGISKWNGWEVDEYSQGRVIVGHNYTGRTGGHTSAVLNTELYEIDHNTHEKSYGGLRDVVLTVDEIPAHDHSDGNYKYLLKKNEEGYESIKETDSTEGEPNLKVVGEIESEGGDKPHQNMPPYIVYLNVVKI